MTIEEIEQSLQSINDLLKQFSGPPVDVATTTKLDLVIELLINIHKQQEINTNRIVKAIESRRLQ